MSSTTRLFSSPNTIVVSIVDGADPPAVPGTNTNPEYWNLLAHVLDRYLFCQQIVLVVVSTVMLNPISGVYEL